VRLALTTEQRSNTDSAFPMTSVSVSLTISSSNMAIWDRDPSAGTQAPSARRTPIVLTPQ
jgi:hypothetical protein